MKYYYGMRLRPYGIGCQPMKGLVKVHEDYIEHEEDERGFWNILEYDRELSEQEVEQYELKLVGFCGETERKN